jgi:hypothetical protein
MLQVDPIQSYLNLKIGLPPVLKAGSSGKYQIRSLRNGQGLKNLNLDSKEIFSFQDLMRI